MPLRPFPYPLNMGLDICSIQRVKTLLQSRSLRLKRLKRLTSDTPPKFSLTKLHPFLTGVFSFREILLFGLRFKGVLHEPGAEHDPALVNSVVRYLAGRFAAKEAVIKAVHSRRIFFKDVLVATEGSRPYAIVLDESPILTQVQRLYLNQNHGFSLSINAEAKSLSSADLTSHPDVDPALERCHGQIAKLSISHDGDYATAVCLAVEQPEPVRHTLPRTLPLPSILQELRVALKDIRVLNLRVYDAMSGLSELNTAYFKDREPLSGESPINDPTAVYQYIMQAGRAQGKQTALRKGVRRRGR